MTEHQTLSDLLTELFTADELLDWIRRLPGGGDLPRALADRALTTLAADAEALLRRHGYVDAALFDALVAARPRREAEIRALGAQLPGAKAGSTASVAPPPAASAAPTPKFGVIHNHGPSQQGDGNTMTVQTASGGMIFNAPVNVSGGHLGPSTTLTPGTAPAPSAAHAPVSTSSGAASAAHRPPSNPTPSTAPPSADPKFRDLRELLAKRQVLVICGAGTSLAATGGAPTAGWSGLLRSGVEHCRAFSGVDDRWCASRLRLIDEGETEDLIHVGMQVIARLGGPTGGECRAWLRATVGSLKATDTSLLQAISELGCPIATTNYDDLLEQATGLRTVSWDETAEVDRVVRGDEPGVLHLHGHWRRPESIVLGVDSYLKVRDAPHARAVREALRTTRSLLFIGCGATTEDPNIGAWLRWSGEVFAGAEYRNYRLEKDSDVTRVQVQHPQEQRLFVLGYGPDHAELPGFLRGLVA